VNRRFYAQLMKKKERTKISHSRKKEGETLYSLVAMCPGTTKSKCWVRLHVICAHKLGVSIRYDNTRASAAHYHRRRPRRVQRRGRGGETNVLADFSGQRTSLGATFPPETAPGCLAMPLRNYREKREPC
jgi:hypothetical protein